MLRKKLQFVGPPPTKSLWERIGLSDFQQVIPCIPMKRVHKSTSKKISQGQHSTITSTNKNQPSKKHSVSQERGNLGKALMSLIETIPLVLPHSTSVELLTGELHYAFHCNYLQVANRAVSSYSITSEQTAIVPSLGDCYLCGAFLPVPWLIILSMPQMPPTQQRLTVEGSHQQVK